MYGKQRDINVHPLVAGCWLLLKCQLQPTVTATYGSSSSSSSSNSGKTTEFAPPPLSLFLSLWPFLIRLLACKYLALLYK